MILDDIITKIRDVYGLSSSEKSDDQLTTLIDAARKKVSVLYPFNELTSTTTVAGTTRYSVSHTDLIRLKEVYYPRSVESSPFGTEIPDSISISVGDISRHYELIARLKLMTEVYPTEGRIVDHNQFELLPTPETTGSKVWYEYLRYRTLAEIPDIFEDDLIAYMFFLIKDGAFKKRSMTEGDGFMFDRRGNIKVDAETVDGDKAHVDTENRIKASIKSKVMMM